MPEIGDPEEYIVRVEETATLPYLSSYNQTDRQAETVPLHDLPWASIDYNRVVNETSVARIVVANDLSGSSCCPFPLTAWDMAIGIYRNGLRVWWGPIMGWRRGADGSFEIAAMDATVFLKRKLVSANRTATSITALNLIELLLDDVVTETGITSPWHIFRPSATKPYYLTTTSSPNVTQVITRSSLQTLFDIFRSLTDSWGGGFTMLPAGMQWVGEDAKALSQVYDTSAFYYTPDSPRLNATTVVDMPSIEVDASQMAGHTWQAEDSAGSAGEMTVSDATALLSAPTDYVDYTAFIDILESTASTDQRVDATTFDDRVQVTATYGLQPAVTMSAITLSPRFGAPPPSDFGIAGVRQAVQFLNFNSLIPGRTIAVWGFDSDCMEDTPYVTHYSTRSFFYSPSLNCFMLDALNVRVEKTDDGLTETVQASFHPYDTRSDMWER